MKQGLFDKIAKSNFVMHSSFALWDDVDITKVDIICSNIAKLTTQTVIVGLNPSGSKETALDNRLRCFHWKYRGCRDYYLRAAFQGGSPKFVGCYMTDIVPSNPSKVQKGVDVSARDLSSFIDELEFVEFFSHSSPVIVALGKKAYSVLVDRVGFFGSGISFKDFVERKHKKTIRIEYISHHARRGYRKDQFVDEVRQLSRKLWP